LKNPTLTCPRLVTLPSWIRLIQNPIEGKYDDKFDHRQANTSFVGLPGDCNDDASGYDSSYVEPTVHFPKLGRIRGGTSLGPVEPSVAEHDMSLTVRGLIIGRVSFKNEPFGGIITQECLTRLGWSFDRGNGTVSEVPDRLWQTLVADRDENGKNAPLLYQFACREAIE
jgi:hypothetical protein